MTIAKDSSLLEAGFDLCVSPSAMLGLSYLGEFASGASPTDQCYGVFERKPART